MRNEYIDKGITSFSANEYNDIINEYDNKKMDKTICDDRDEVLYFLKDFNVFATNNNAKSSQRGVKIKQKIGKFRSVEGSKNYLVIKSCILTYKKHNIDIHKALYNAFECKNIIAS